MAAIPRPMHYSFNVIMSCPSCSKAVEKSLAKLGPEVTKVETSVELGTVDVYSTLSYETIHQQIIASGKEVKGGKQL